MTTPSPSTTNALYHGTEYRNNGNSEVLGCIPDSVRRVLDIGCGAGDNARILQARGCEVWGVTLSEREAESSRPFCHSVLVSNIEHEDLAAPLGSFDAIICSHVMEHLVRPDLALVRLQKHLAPDGRIVIAVRLAARARLKSAAHGPDPLLAAQHLGDEVRVVGMGHDPAATGAYAVPAIQGVLEQKVPVFGICLGHQLLGLASGARTVKMKFGHHGANHPVMDLRTRKVEITSQNHNFAVQVPGAGQGVPERPPVIDTTFGKVAVTHVSLNDHSIEGLACLDQPVFSVQYHPEASPGPHDSAYLFNEFVQLMENAHG